jgi:hypothetical protein
MTRSPRSLALLVAPLAASQMGTTTCGGDVLRDPGFDLWCGDRLCDWKTEHGAALRVATWHDGDDGVELAGDDVLITQQSPVTSGDSTCIEFSMLTDVALDADVHLQFDVFGDGTIDHDQVVPTAHWEPVSYLVKFTAPYTGIKFRLSKRGPGRAVLAEIRAKTRKAEECPGDPIALPPGPEGAFCLKAEQCASGVCNPSVAPTAYWIPPPTCGTCAKDADCTGGAICGVDDAVPWWLDPYRACVPPASRDVGELCAVDAECASGACTHGACSTCGPKLACAGGEACVAIDGKLPGVLPEHGDGTWPTPPSLCSAGAGVRKAGETCLRAADCASARCTGHGTLSICNGDGRTCTTELDCPASGSLAHEPCVEVGIAGGTCQ